MTYKFLEPKIEDNVFIDTWNSIKNKWLFWLSFLPVLIFPPFFIIPLVYFYFIFNKINADSQGIFWKELARINGWQYKDIQQAWNVKELGVMFKKGHSRFIKNEIYGVFQGRSFRIFSYTFFVGSDKHQQKYTYTVFAFKFNGSFPHMCIDSKYDFFEIYEGKKIPLPGDFEKKFSLFAPSEYEIEALEIFTPDILIKLIDSDFPYDVEFVNQEILIFAERVKCFEQFERRFNRSLELQDLMYKKLDKFKFEQIGDITSILS